MTPATLPSAQQSVGLRTPVGEFNPPDAPSERTRPSLGENFDLPLSGRCWQYAQLNMPKPEGAG